jgi:hypothetical protein
MVKIDQALNWFAVSAGTRANSVDPPGVRGLLGVDENADVNSGRITAVARVLAMVPDGPLVGLKREQEIRRSQMMSRFQTDPLWG